MNKDYIKNLRSEYSQITDELSKTTQPGKLKKLTRRHIELGRILEKYDELSKIKKELKDNKKILEESQDQEFKKLAEEEVEKLEKRLPKTELELKRLLVPKDPTDSNDAIVEIRPGAGGDEAGLFAAELLRMYTRYAERKGWKVDINSISKSELGGIKEAIIEIKGDGAYGQLKYEGGVHRVQRVPETEKSGRVHTSTASVAVLPSVEEGEFELDPNDVNIETSTSQGPGGQSVNTTYSAIKATHIPTGIAAKSQDQKSQHQNKEKAMKVLRARVAAHFAEQRDKELRDERRSQIKGAQRSDKVRTYNFPQDRITDHRINENFHKIETRLDGEIDPIIKELKELDEQEKLEKLEKQ